MAEPFSAESRLIHAGTERVPGQTAADLITDIDQALEVL
jgi:hypothetical protein